MNEEIVKKKISSLGLGLGLVYFPAISHQPNGIEVVVGSILDISVIVGWVGCVSLWLLACASCNQFIAVWNLTIARAGFM